MKKVINFVFSFQFSKFLIIMESIIVLYLTKHGIDLARLCIEQQFDGSLPWVATMVTAAWAAYGVSAAFYYNKGKAEEVEKIKATGNQYYEGDEPTI